jgi:hypothetical protein
MPNFNQQSGLPEYVFSMNITLFNSMNELTKEQDFILKYSVDWEIADFNHLDRVNKGRFDNYICRLNTPPKNVFYKMRQDENVSEEFLKRCQAEYKEIKKYSTDENPEKYADFDNVKVGRICESNPNNNGEVMPFYFAIVMREIKTQTWYLVMMIDEHTFYWCLNDTDFSVKQVESGVIAKLHLSKKPSRSTSKAKSHKELAEQRLKERMIINALKGGAENE